MTKSCTQTWQRAGRRRQNGLIFYCCCSTTTSTTAGKGLDFRTGSNFFCTGQISALRCSLLVVATALGLVSIVCFCSPLYFLTPATTQSQQANLQATSLINLLIKMVSKQKLPSCIACGFRARPIARIIIAARRSWVARSHSQLILF